MLRVPVRAHWAVNAFCERGPMKPKTMPDSGTVMSATSASFHEMENIMASTPTTVRMELSAVDRVCWSVLFTLSTSLVRRESTSPRRIRSKWLRGRRWIFCSTRRRRR